MLAELTSAKQYGVFIDDTGSPGMPVTSGGLHPDRKTWVAVIVPPQHVHAVIIELPGAIDELREATGASEFHFTDIFGGNRQFKRVDVELRMNLIRFTASLFRLYKFPILVQTLDPATLAALRSRGSLPTDLGPFDFTQPADTALFLLLVKLKDFLERQRASSRWSARVFIDEGWKKEETSISIPSFGGAFADAAIYFAKSSTVLPLQLADFAAFCLNRMQLIRSRDKVKAIDLELLKVLKEMLPNYIELPREEVEFISQADERNAT